MCVFALMLRNGHNKFLWLVAIVIALNFSHIKAFISTPLSTYKFNSSREIPQQLSLITSPFVRSFSLAAATIDKATTTTSDVKAASNNENANTKDNGGKKKKKRNGDVGAMEVVVLGLSHHNAAVEIREKLAIPEASWNEVNLL